MASMVTSPITIDYPATGGDLELRIDAGACRLTIVPAAGDTWITGSYHDPSGSIRVESALEANRAWIHVGRSPADIFGFFAGVPELELQLGRQRPFLLSIAAGASENHLELGGLPIKRLEISHGAGSVEVHFSAAVPVATSLLKFGVGAGKTNVYGLGYVNFEDLLVEGGAASCVLDFSGAGLKSGAARLSTAMASLELRIPAILATEVISENLLGRPVVDGGFALRGGTWLNNAAALGKPVQLRIRSSMVMGQLRLSTLG